MTRDKGQEKYDKRYKTGEVEQERQEKRQIGQERQDKKVRTREVG